MGQSAKSEHGTAGDRRATLRKIQAAASASPTCDNARSPNDGTDAQTRKKKEERKSRTCFLVDLNGGGVVLETNDLADQLVVAHTHLDFRRRKHPSVRCATARGVCADHVPARTSSYMAAPDMLSAITTACAARPAPPRLSSV